MNNELQELMVFLSKHHNLTLTSILSVTDTESWEQNKHTLLSSAPFLTLEMAINRVSDSRKRNSIPTPQTIYEAVKYAAQKRKQYSLQHDNSYVEKNDAA